MMKIVNTRTAARVLSVLAVSVVSGGCAMKGDIRLLQEELRQVAARQDSLMAEIRAETLQTQDTLRTQGDQMFDLRGDLNRQLQQINQRLQRIEALAGENQRGLTGIRDQLANLRRAPAGGGMPTGMPQDGAGQEVVGGESLIGGADELWEVASSAVQRGSVNTAGTAFRDFISEYPEDPRVPRAQFILADVLFQQDQPEDALAAFQEIASLYPTNDIVPETLYRVGTIQVELDDLDGARATFERIINTYPGHMMSMLARDELEEIGGG
ncbi:MAG: tetratricopeptide repeat protein [Gemmatimonadota bacterium]